MTEAVTNELIYSVLQKIQGDVSDLRFDVSELKVRATATEAHLGNMILSSSSLNRHMDRFDDRMARVERRLDLTDAH